ncbi:MULTISPECIES: conjugative transposon protein TraM [unclassified Flavobacterium]|uniref:conjugative transposon protein TraM n=1 Tax=unclassified Flavobacterium TaxID=196869 RepID=UPI0006AB87FC|nr:MULTISPECIES: conjugative transposon protein TraM [unclassified Flavobacterium]KOP38894.1 conjugal transfer protein TraM [Flavobacterium sp. VMW]OWU92845.1 conjugal transfer protein TraM [Flavobacterium sp. NLM]
MKEAKKKVSLFSDEAVQSSTSFVPVEKKTAVERFKKPLIFTLMGIVCIGCMYLIFKPSTGKKQIENLGLNDSVPQASGSVLQADKQKAYEQEMLQDKEEHKKNALTALSDYWNEDSDKQKQALPDETQEPKNPALSTYRSAQSALGSFYQQDNGETKELRRQLEELKEELTQKDIPVPASIDDQLTLMEKSYQMAAKYLPSGSNSIGPAGKNAAVANEEPQKKDFSALVPAKKNRVSSLYRPASDSTFLTDLSKSGNNGFYTTGVTDQAQHPKNSIRACVHQTQTISGEAGVVLRLLEAARISGHKVSAGTMITANAKIQEGRLQLKISSVELDGSIIPVEIIIYDLDGQQGVPVPYSAERNALTEMAGNMSQQSGTSLMMTQSAGQQVAADLSRGVVQGISGYFAKKVKTPKVILKAGHQVFLVSKK